MLATSTAINIADRMLPASALFFPAMSNAVPWSGLVRTIGNPSVMFTDPLGLVMMIGAGLWLGVGVFWMSRLVKVEV